MLLLAIVPWLLVFFLSYSFASLFYKKVGLTKIVSLVVGFSLGPLAAAQILYLLYSLTPMYSKGYYLVAVSLLLLLIGVFILVNGNFLPLRMPKTRMRLPRLDTSSSFYILAIGITVFVTFVKMLFWPISWSDQVDYYFQAHSYATIRAHETDILNPLNSARSIGIRPGLPVLVSYFTLFNNNSIVAEKQLQLVIFYYYCLSLTILFLLTKEFSKSIKGGLFSIFLLVTCYYFTNFVIFGFKEIIIIVLFLCFALILAHIGRLQKTSLVKFSLLSGAILGAMSFIHFAGTALAILLGATFFLASSSGLKQKLIFLIIVFIIASLLSLGETTFFFHWLFGEASLPALVQKVNTSVPDRLKEDIVEGRLVNYGILTSLDVWIKGKLQAFTQIHYFGLVYWFSLVSIILQLKNIIKIFVNRFFGIFALFFTLVVINPFSLVNHNAVRVLVSSPKYYLLLLPFLIVLASNNFQAYAGFFKRVPRFILIGGCLSVGIVSTVAKQNAAGIFSLLSPILVSNFRSTSYYVNKLVGLTDLYFWASLLFLLTALIYWRKAGRGIAEVVFSTYLFFLPFVFFLNNNQNLIKVVTQAFSSRETKIALTDVIHPGFSENISIIVKEHKSNEKVLIYGQSGSIVTNYYLLTKHDLFFKEFGLQVFADDNSGDELPTGKYDWIICKPEVVLQQMYREGYRVVNSNSDSVLMKLASHD